MGHDGDAPAVGALAFGGGLQRLERLGAEHLLERHLEHHKAGGFAPGRSRGGRRAGRAGDDRVDIRLGKGALALVVEDELDVAVFEEKLLQVCAVADIEPGVGGDEAEAALRVEQRQPVQVEVDVEVAFAVELAEIGPPGFVAEESRPRSGNGLLEVWLCRLFSALSSGRTFRRRSRWVERGRGDHFLPNVGRIADDDVEAAFVPLEDFHKGDVPDKGDVLRAAERTERAVMRASSACFSSRSARSCAMRRWCAARSVATSHSRQRILLLGRRFDLAGERGDLVLQRVLFVVEDGAEEIELFLFEVGFAQVLAGPGKSGVFCL
ncbi:MAG: hypothetical protein KatS3mg040_1846 [Candidatus Kapaibacterium sp.]|nr:MAG: hypothetical protein KatS3mg040_1846 [Candidatus Kapabacteria bacterium]